MVLRGHLEYGRTEKPTKLQVKKALRLVTQTPSAISPSFLMWQELLGLEALFSSINSRLSLLG